MLDDANKVPGGSTLLTTVCIVGAGAAGITLAREFAKRGRHQVILLESGGFDYDDRTQHLYRGSSDGIDYDLETSRLRFFGGSTNHWSSWCRPLDEAVFEARDWVPNSGWPFARAELEPYYARAQTVCNLGPFRYDVAYWRNRLPTLSTLLDGGNVRTSLLQVGPRTRFGVDYRIELVGASNVRVMLNANVVNVRSDPGRVTGVDVATLDGNRFSVDAPVVVLAIGGIENARLLLASRGTNPFGLGNDHDLVGRYFMDHPHYIAGRLVLSDQAPEVSAHVVGIPMAEAGIPDADSNAPRSVLAALAPTPNAARAAGIPGFMATLIPDGPAGGDDPGIGDTDVEHLIGDVEGRSATPRPTKDVKIFTGDTVHLANRVGVYVRGEPTPNPESRVALTAEVDRLGVPRANLHWDLAAEDWASLDRAIELLGVELGRRGLGRAHRRPAALYPLVGGMHHMGTTRMAGDPSRGVVDEHVQVHGVANLYVAGSSVFPTAGTANPTLTIVALALRLADRLDRVLRS